MIGGGGRPLRCTLVTATWAVIAAVSGGGLAAQEVPPVALETLRGTLARVAGG